MTKPTSPKSPGTRQSEGKMVQSKNNNNKNLKKNHLDHDAGSDKSQLAAV